MHANGFIILLLMLIVLNMMLTITTMTVPPRTSPHVWDGYSMVINRISSKRGGSLWGGPFRPKSVDCQQNLTLSGPPTAESTGYYDQNCSPHPRSGRRSAVGPPRSAAGAPAAPGAALLLSCGFRLEGPAMAVAHNNKNGRFILIMINNNG